MKTVGVILAGGLSRRFGSPKAFAKIEGQYFYEYAIHALKPYCDEIIIVTRPELVKKFPEECQVIVDDPAYAGDGPLAGIYSAMKVSMATRYIVLPCDMPYINQQFLEGLLQNHKPTIVAVRTVTQHHPLVSVWKPTVFKELEETLNKKQFRVFPFLEKVQAEWIDAKVLGKDYEKVLQNMNYQTDLERGEET